MPYHQSPLNYTGGKYKLLQQIEPLFPRDVNVFVDLFCGGGNVGANVECNEVWFNDLDRNVTGILELFHDLPVDQILRSINNIIDQFHLSRVSQNGYEYYGCNSKTGLGDYNRPHFNELRARFNSLHHKTANYYLTLYVLIVYTFNNQIRFNSKGEFNLPVGKRDFNEKMHNKLVQFVELLHNCPCQFTHQDFRRITPDQLHANDFVYADPPYLITCAAYNENGGWTEDLEYALYDYLDNLDAHHIRFALSNVMSSKGRVNTILQEWVAQHDGHYHCHHLDFNYSNSNYHTLDRQSGSDEVLITNY